MIITARYGSRVLQKLPAEDRARAIYTLAELLIQKQADILDANEKDIAKATKEGTSGPLLSRLSLTPAKLKSLAVGKINSMIIIDFNLFLFHKNIKTNEFYISKNSPKHIHRRNRNTVINIKPINDGIISVSNIA